MRINLDYFSGSILFIIFWIVGTRVIRQKIKNPFSGEQHLVLGLSVTLFATMFAFLGGFTIVNLWEDYVKASSVVRAETAALHAMARIAQFDRSGDRLRAEIRNYATAVVEDEWSTMAAGKISARAEGAKEAVWRETLAFIKTNRGDVALEQTQMDNLIRFDTARLHRAEFVPGTLHPLILSGVMVLGFFTLLGYTLIDAGHRKIQSIVDGFVVITVVLIVYLILEINAPFCGTGVVVSDAAYRELLAELM